MKNIFRFVVAALLVGAMAILSGGTWAAPIFAGTVPKPPDQGGGDGARVCEPIDMGTALFIPQCDETLLAVTVTLVEDPGKDYAAAPEGMAFVGDTFKVEIEPDSGAVKVCYAYPPEFAARNAKIYKLNENAAPPVWVEVAGATIGDGVICAISIEGVFSLIGNP